jgi:cell division protein FtsB
MTKIALLLLLGASIVSADELNVNKQLNKDVEVKQKLLIKQQEKNRKIKQEITVLTETVNRITGIEKDKGQKQSMNKLLYFNPLDGSHKIDKFGSSNKSQFAKYENSTLLIENNDPKKKANVCGKWLKVPEGKKILFSVFIKAENVTGKQIKFGLMIDNSKGEHNWPSARIGVGTFDWYKVSFSTVVPFGVNRCLLFYGLESGTGKVYFKDIKVEIIE